MYLISAIYVSLSKVLVLYILLIYMNNMIWITNNGYICNVYYWTMINNLDFAHRLNKVMDYYQLSAASFADKINVQRSSISHLLSGRNKPSLDFVLKVL